MRGKPTAIVEALSTGFGPLEQALWSDSIWRSWWLHLLNIGFFIPAVYILLTRRGQSNMHGARLTLGMNTFFQASLFCVYCFTACAHMFLQAQTRSTEYSVVSATILIYFGKTVVCLAMHARSFCSNLPCLIQPAGGRFGRVPACVCTAVPAALFVSYDLFSFLSLAEVDPLTYRIVVQCRILLSAAAWQLCFRRWCSSLQWFAMVTFVVAGITKSLDSFALDSERARDYKIILLLGQVVLSAGGSVCVEMLQKELPVPTDLQNAAICFQGLLFLLPFAMRQGFSTLHNELLGAEAWGRLAGEPWMVASILCLVVHGIITAYFLREMSVVLKEMTGTVVTVASAFAEWAVVRSSSFSLVGFESVVVVVMALLVYNVDPVASRRASKVDGSKPVAEEPSRDALCHDGLDAGAVLSRAPVAHAG